MMTIRRANERGHAGDGVAVSDESKLELVGKGKAQVLLFDLN
jgi:hypothetical protein